MDGHLKTTHIIIPSPDYQSTRLGTAQEWGIQVVLPQWVEQMALACPLLSPSADVSEATSADFEAEGRMAEGMQENAPSSHTDTEADKPLSRCRVHISRKVQDWRDLEKLAVEMGARTIHVLDTDTAKSATHLVFQSHQAKPASREYNIATSTKIKVVHPDWLRHTAEKGIRQAEASYKHTRSSRRGLEVVIQSQHMSRASSSSSSKSHPDATGSDELDLPPPLKSTLSAPTPTLQGMHQSPPRTIRSPRSPPSPARASAELTSSATIASTPEKNRSAFDEYNQYNPDIINRAADDSGFIPSAGKCKDSAKRLVATSSAPDMKPDAQSEGPVANKARNIMAEMQALMQADVSPQQLYVRLPFPQQSGFSSRTNMRKSIARSGESGSPNGLTRSPTASNVDSTAFARRQAYSSYVETQFGQIRSDEKETQAAFDEQTMIIRINDPVAEATKAKLLAGIRGIKTETSDILDEEATQHTMQESRQATSRSSRAAVTSRRR